MSLITRRNVIKSAIFGAVTTGTIAASKSVYAVEKSQKNTFDVIVLGAGPAGLVTAISAKEAGAKKVLLLEKMDRPSGNSIFALGGVCAWGTKKQKEANVKETQEEFYNAMMATSKQRGDKKLNAVYAENIPAAVDWLENTIGIEFEPLTKKPAPMLWRIHRVKAEGVTGGSQMVRKLLEAALKEGVEIRYENKAIELLTNSKLQVIGVKVLTPEGTKEFYSKGGVAVATGGFSANPEMVDKYIGGWVTRLVLRGSPDVTGENVTLTKPLFAKFVNMDQFHCGPIIEATHMNPATLLNSNRGIYVNSAGKRFMDEKNTYVIKARTVGEKTIDNVGWVIIDSSWPGLIKELKKMDSLNSPYGKADSIEEVAKQVGLPIKAVKEEVERYNRAVKEGALKNLSPACSYPNPVALDKAPFYAIPFQGGMTATFGGPLINERAEVQNLERKSIPGLYAVGNASGGLFFHNYIGGAQLGAATVFGRIAGQQMAKRALRANN